MSGKLCIMEVGTNAITADESYSKATTTDSESLNVISDEAVKENINNAVVKFIYATAAKCQNEHAAATAAQQKLVMLASLPLKDLQHMQQTSDINEQNSHNNNNNSSLIYNSNTVEKDTPCKHQELKAEAATIINKTSNLTQVLRNNNNNNKHNNYTTNGVCEQHLDLENSSKFIAQTAATNSTTHTTAAAAETTTCVLTTKAINNNNNINSNKTLATNIETKKSYASSESSASSAISSLCSSYSSTTTIASNHSDVNYDNVDCGVDAVVTSSTRRLNNVDTLSTLAKKVTKQTAAQTNNKQRNNNNNNNQKNQLFNNTTTTTTTATYGGNGVVSIKHSYRIPSDILDDLASRFVINVPDIELTNLIRICFQIELAHWFYLDFFCSTISKHQHNQQLLRERKKQQQIKEQLLKKATEQTASTEAIVDIVPDESAAKLQPCGIKYFALQLFEHIPFLRQHSASVDKILEDWKNYKLSVPTFGAILISEDLNYCLLVQSYYAKSSWGFPKGKVNENEDPVHCAVREVYEETGYDISHIIDPNDYIESVINYQYTRLYLVRNVSLKTQFAPRTRYEIKCCDWFPIDSLPVNKSDAISKSKLGIKTNSFFMIMPFVKRLKRWVNEKRNTDMLSMSAVALTNSSTKTATTTTLALPIANSATTTPIIKNINGNNRRRYYSANGTCTSPTALENTSTPMALLLSSGKLLMIGGNNKADADFDINGDNNAKLISNNNHARAGRDLVGLNEENINCNKNSNKKEKNDNNLIEANRRQLQLCLNINQKYNTLYANIHANMQADYDVNKTTNCIKHSQSAVKVHPAMNRLRGRQRYKSMGDLEADAVATGTTATTTTAAVATTNNMICGNVKLLTRNGICYNNKLINNDNNNITPTHTEISFASSFASYNNTTTAFTPIAAITNNVNNPKRQLFHSQSVNENQTYEITELQQQTEELMKQLQLEPKQKEVNAEKMMELSSIEESSVVTKRVYKFTPKRNVEEQENHVNDHQRMRSQASMEKTIYKNNSNNNNNNYKNNVEQKQRSWVITNSHYRSKNVLKAPNSYYNNIIKNGMNSPMQYEKQQRSGKTTPNNIRLPRKSYSERNTPIEGLSGCLAAASSSVNCNYVYPKPKRDTPPMSGLDLLALAAAAATDNAIAADAATTTTTPTPTVAKLNTVECKTPLVPYVPNVEQDIAYANKTMKCNTPKMLLTAEQKDTSSMSSAKTSSNSTLSVLTSSSSSSSSFIAMDSPISYSASPVLMQQQLEPYAQIKHPKPIMAMPSIMQSPITTAAELEALALQRAKTAAFNKKGTSVAASFKARALNNEQAKSKNFEAFMQQDELAATTSNGNENINGNGSDAALICDKSDTVNKIKVNAWINFKFTKTFVRDLFH